MKLTMKELLKEWRQVLNEHVTDEEHEHPHGDEADEIEEGSSCSDTSSSSNTVDEKDEHHHDETIEEMFQTYSLKQLLS